MTQARMNTVNGKLEREQKLRDQVSELNIKQHNLVSH